MTVRAKFFVESVTKYENQAGAFVVLSPVGYGKSEENKAFWEATPAGRVEMSISNPGAAAQFAEGQEFYLDFTPVTAQLMDVEKCAACGNDHVNVPPIDSTADGGTFQCPDSGKLVGYTNNGAPAAGEDPRNSI